MVVVPARQPCSLACWQPYICRSWLYPPVRDLWIRLQCSLPPSSYISTTIIYCLGLFLTRCSGRYVNERFVGESFCVLTFLNVTGRGETTRPCPPTTPPGSSITQPVTQVLWNWNFFGQVTSRSGFGLVSYPFYMKKLNIVSKLIITEVSGSVNISHGSRPADL